MLPLTRKCTVPRPVRRLSVCKYWRHCTDIDERHVTYLVPANNPILSQTTFCFNETLPVNRPYNLLTLNFELLVPATTAVAERQCQILLLYRASGQRDLFRLIVPTTDNRHTDKQTAVTVQVIWPHDND